LISPLPRERDGERRAEGRPLHEFVAKGAVGVVERELLVNVERVRAACELVFEHPCCV
jgi:hypothetical protein